MSESSRSLWTTRLGHVYGTLSGQRGLDLDRLRQDCSWLSNARSVEDAIIALQTYFAFAAEFLACAYATQEPTTFARAFSEEVDLDLASALEQVSAGRRLRGLGFTGAEEAFPFSWFASALDDEAKESWRAFTDVLATTPAGDFQSLQTLPDPLGFLYAELIPKNILHALGEFYTPRWLADVLIDELNLHGSERVLDPFCGSGVFLLAALDSKVAAGVSPREACTQLLGVDLNPAACVAARTNLVLALRRHGVDSLDTPVALQVLCADSFGPALLRAQQAESPLAPRPPKLVIDGAKVRAHPPGPTLAGEISARLADAGLELDPEWLDSTTPVSSEASADLDRRFWEQHALSCLKPSDVIATNPPWVGWEYQSRSFRTYVQPGWEYYDLYSSRGANKAFLKEDLSTLALVAVWDTLLKDGGASTAVIRSATMTSSIASSGLRRLSIHPRRNPLKLTSVNILDDIRPFHKAQVEASTWTLVKGESTSFPVDVRIWNRRKKRWQPSPQDKSGEVLELIERHVTAVSPTDPSEPSGRWMTGPRACIELSAQMKGPCPYKARTGVFTGGANAVYYLERSGEVGPDSTRYSNVVARSKRAAPKVEAEIEDALVYEIVRGRDLKRWQLCGHGLLLCPHTAETKMDAIPPDEMERHYPAALRYLSSMREVLDARGGFTKWEQPFRDRAFYVIQRIGDYTFADYKVCWKYIAKDFISAVIGPDTHGKPRLPNDKIMSIAAESEAAAYYLCGVLSSSPVRWQVLSHTSGTQISASSIESIGIPLYDPTDEIHGRISALCMEGHRLLSTSKRAGLGELEASLDQQCALLFGWGADDVLAFRKALASLGL